MVENKVHSLLSFPAISSVSPAFHNPMMTETCTNTPTLSPERWESAQSVSTSRCLNTTITRHCWFLNSVFRWCLFSFRSITILYVYNFSWFCYLKIKWKMSLPPWHWHNYHNKNFHPEKSGKKKSLGPTLMPMEWILTAQRTVTMGEWVNLE